MPEYIYMCPEGHEELVEEPMFAPVAHKCARCSQPMWRKPKVLAVNWNGLRPSQGFIHPDIKQHIEAAEERNRGGSNV